jgi:L-ribulose-5-phosphate 3-epimerase
MRNDRMPLHKTTHLPFVTGYALQNYSCAEKGMLDAAENGYQYWYMDASLPSNIFKEWDSQRITNLIHHMELYLVKPILHGNYKVPLASDVDELRTAALQYTKKEIDLAAAFSAPLIIHGGVIVEPRQMNTIKKEALNNFLYSIDELASYALKKNVSIYLENLSNYKNYRPFSYIFTHDEEFDYLLSRSDLSFFLDIGHANIGNESPQEIFRKYASRIVGMSFSNNNGQQDQHLSLRRGSIDYEQLILCIAACEWKGIIAFETRDESPRGSIHELNQIYHKTKIKAVENT